jgi:3-oxoadipate enol-lactonase
MPNAFPSAGPYGEDVCIAVGDEAVTARVLGAGRPVVLLHSLLADRSSFDPLAALLATTHRVILLDLPGFGGSRPVAGGLEAVADRVAEAIRALRLEQSPVLLGNGYGGFVALLTAIRHPSIAARLVLADCGAAFSEPGRQAFRNMSAAASAKGLAAIADVAMRRLFAPAFQEAHPALVEQRRARFLAVHPETFHAACAALAALDLRSQCPAWPCPCWCWWASRTRPRRRRWRASSPRCCPTRASSCCPDAPTCRSCRRRSSSWLPSPNSWRAEARRDAALQQECLEAARGLKRPAFPRRLYPSSYKSRARPLRTLQLGRSIRSQAMHVPFASHRTSPAPGANLASTAKAATASRAAG